jgi:hypothetical protein
MSLREDDRRRWSPGRLQVEGAMQGVKVVDTWLLDKAGRQRIIYMTVCHPFSFMMSIQKASLPSSDCRHVSLISVIN